MAITIHAGLKTRLRARAEAVGMSVESYFEQMTLDDQAAEEEIETLALEGLHSGEPI